MWRLRLQKMEKKKNKLNHVFLFSLPRSGSTFLSRVLDKHSLISSPPETWLLLFYNHLFNSQVVTYPIGINTCYLAALTFLSSQESLLHNTTNLFITSLKFRLKFLAMFFRKNSIKDQLVKKLVVNSFNNHLINSNKSIFIDKTPRNYILLDYINRNFKNNLKIYLRRDPRDIANSYNKTWNISINEIVGQKNVSVNSKDFSQGLVELEDYFLNNKKPNHLIVEYKDLVLDNKATLHKICSFLSIAYEPNMLSFKKNDEQSIHFRNEFVGDFQSNKKLRTSDQSFYPGKYNKELSKNEIEILNKYFKIRSDNKFSFKNFKSSKYRHLVNTRISELEEEILTPLYEILSLKKKV